MNSSSTLSSSSAGSSIDVDRDAPLGVALAAHVALLHGIAGAERHERAAVQHSAADVEGGLDDEHVGAEIARANRRREPRATGADDEDVAFVVPADLAASAWILRFGTARAEQRRRSEPCRAARDDVSPRDAGFVAVARGPAASSTVRFVMFPPDDCTSSSYGSPLSRRCQ